MTLQACLHTLVWSRQTTTSSTWCADLTLWFITLTGSTVTSCGRGCGVFSRRAVCLRRAPTPVAASSVDRATSIPVATATPSRLWTSSLGWRSTSRTRSTLLATSLPYLASNRPLLLRPVLPRTPRELHTCSLIVLDLSDGLGGLTLPGT